MKNTKNQRGATSPGMLIGIVVGVVVIVLVILFVTGVFNSEETSTTNSTANINTGIPAQTLVATPYTDSVYNFSIQYPEGWERDTDDNVTAIYTPEETDESDRAMVNINSATFTEDLTQDLFDEVIIQSKLALSEFTGLEYIIDKSNNKNNTFGHIFEHITTQDGVDIHSLQLIFMKDGQTFVITGGTQEDSWLKLKNTIEAMFDTFTIL